MSSPSTTVRSGPRLLQPEKARAWQRGPAQSKRGKSILKKRTRLLQFAKQGRGCDLTPKQLPFPALGETEMLD